MGADSLKFFHQAGWNFGGAIVAPAPLADIGSLVRFELKSMLFARCNPIAYFFCNEQPMGVPAQMSELFGAEVHTSGRQIRFQVPGEQLGGTSDEGNFAGTFEELFVRSKGFRHSV